MNFKEFVDSIAVGTAKELYQGDNVLHIEYFPDNTFKITLNGECSRSFVKGEVATWLSMFEAARGTLTTNKEIETR